jgi:hypothetical protein
MHEYERWPFPRHGLPVAFAANSCAQLGFEFSRYASGQAGKSPREKGRDDRLCVRIAQQRMRFEGLHSNIILRQNAGLPGTAGPLDFARGRA